MSKYRITLDGKTYELEIELMAEESALKSAKREYREFKTAVKDPIVQLIDPSAEKKTTRSSGTVTAPMPGLVIKLLKNEGDTVKAGESVLILEAMKMENEIASPADGTITGIFCTVGKTVSGGEVLFEVQ